MSRLKKKEAIVPQNIDTYDEDNYADSLHINANKPPLGLNIKKNHIFVSVASYRDDRCHSTIDEIFQKASVPSRIWVGICQQHDEKDPDCISNNAKTYNSHIKIQRIPSLGAKGPTWARYQCSLLWDGQEFFLQVDSHTNFAKNWDVELLDMYNKIQERKAIITHYPPKDGQYKTDEELKKWTVVTHDASVNSQNQMISKGKIISRIPFPKETKYISAGFLFAPYEFLLDVPFDPYLPYLFQGEEPLIAMRLSTRGWKIYNPTHCVATHYYTREDAPKFWTDHRQAYDKYNKLSIKRAQYLLGIAQKDPKAPSYIYKYEEIYGAASKRSLDTWHRNIDVDWKNWKKK